MKASDEHVTVVSEMVFPSRTNFHEPMRQGDLAEVLARVVKRGSTSLTVETEMFSDNFLTGVREQSNDGTEGAP